MLCPCDWFVQASAQPRNDELQTKKIQIMKHTLIAGLVVLQCLNADAACPKTDTAQRYAINGDTVTDRHTGLVWARCAHGQVLTGDQCLGQAGTYTHEEALRFASTWTSSDGKRWRLPNRRELLSIVEFGCNYPAIDRTAFPNTPAVWFWSTTPYSADSNKAWPIHFETGAVPGFASYRSNSHVIRLVRQ